MTAYYSSLDAIKDLLAPRGLYTGQRPFESCRITKIPQSVHQITNGIEYCAVEITCKDSTQYGIQAYGREAIELHKEALRLSHLETEEHEKTKSVSLVTAAAV